MPRSFRGFTRWLPIKTDVKYRPTRYDPRSPYVPKGQYAVATKIVAADGSGDFEDIQSAINDLPSSGGVVYLKEGTYEITTTIFLPDNTALIGSGPSTILKFPSGTGAINMIENSDRTNGNENIEISNIFFDGNRFVATSANNLLDFLKLSDAIDKQGLFLHHCIFKDAYYHPLQLSYSQNCIFASNYLWGGYKSVYLDHCSRCALINNTIRGSNTNGIQLYYSNDNSISSNILSSNEEIGLSLSYSNSNMISSNILTENDVEGLVLSYSDLNCISSNQIKRNSFHGILLFHSDDNSISSNVIQSNNTVNEDYDNVQVTDDSNRNNIQTNLIRASPDDFVDYGINIATSDCDDNSVINNDIFNDGFVVGSLNNLGTGTIIKNNVGYNPVGVSSITVGVSPFTYTAGSSPETVYIRGGTVSDISKSSNTLFSETGHSVELKPFESVTVTYSATPTMIKDVH